MVKFKLFLYWFLGKFIKHFKRKHMHHFLSLINRTIVGNLANCTYYNLFTITTHNDIFNQSNNYYEIKYDVQYKGVTFSLVLKYSDATIEKESVSDVLSVNVADMKIIAAFCNCFEKISEDSIIEGANQLNDYLNTPLSN